MLENKVKNICTSLTCTHSYFVPRSVSAVVTVQAPVKVTGVGLGAVLPDLLGTHLAAFTAVGDQANPSGTARWQLRALTRPLAILSPRISLCHSGGGGGHGGGGLGNGLQANRGTRFAVPSGKALKSALTGQEPTPS